MQMVQTLFMAALLTASVSNAMAQQILKNEPPSGAGSTMRPGEIVYVDNGKCPKGQVLKVTAGSLAGGRNATGATGTPRQRECVPRP